MIDFKNAEYLKLRPVSNDVFAQLVLPMFVGNEAIVQTFQGMRDGVVFTNMRVISINVQGVILLPNINSSIIHKEVI